MDILGIGMPELVFIVLIALIVLGPKDMEKTGRAIGRFLNNLVRSEGWQAFRQTSKEVRSLPTRLMREANLDEIQKDVGKIGQELKEATDIKGFGTWGSPGASRTYPQPTRPKPAEANDQPDPIPEPKTQPDEKAE